jgi:hypothetical protein
VQRTNGDGKSSFLSIHLHDLFTFCSGEEGAHTRSAGSGLIYEDYVWYRIDQNQTSKSSKFVSIKIADFVQTYNT